MRLSVRPDTKFIRSLGFSRVVTNAPDTTKVAVLCQPRAPSRQAICFQGPPRCQKEKRSLPGVRANISEFVCVAAFVTTALAHHRHQPVFWLRNINLIPFRAAGACARMRTHVRPSFFHLRYDLGSTHPCPIAVHMEPFSTSVFKVVI